MSPIAGKKIFLILLIFCIESFLLVSNSSSKEFEGIYHIRDAGATPCKNIKNIFNENTSTRKNIILQWTGGFLSAASFFNKVIDVFPIIETSSLIEMSILVCDELSNEDDITYQSIITICINRLKPYWVLKSPAITNLTNSGRSVKIYTESIEPLQKNIIKLGAKIKLDGKFGSETGTILANFHKNLGLDLMPLPNGITLYFLTKPN